MTAPTVQPGVQPVRPRRRPGRHLRPVERPRTRRSPAVPVLVGCGIVIAALFALAAMHALLIGGQLQLDDLQRDAAAETEEIRRLRLRVAELESPDRVLEVARTRLGMVAPDEVGYLLPVGVDGGPEGAVRVAAAAPPPPPEPEVDAAASPEEQEVEASIASEEEEEEGGDGTTTDAGVEDPDAAGVEGDDAPDAATTSAPSEGGPSEAATADGGDE